MKSTFFAHRKTSPFTRSLRHGISSLAAVGLLALSPLAFAQSVADQNPEKVPSKAEACANKTLDALIVKQERLQKLLPQLSSEQKDLAEKTIRQIMTLDLSNAEADNQAILRQYVNVTRPDVLEALQDANDSRNQLKESIASVKQGAQNGDESSKSQLKELQFIDAETAKTQTVLVTIRDSLQLISSHLVCLNKK